MGGAGYSNSRQGSVPGWSPGPRIQQENNFEADGTAFVRWHAADGGILQEEGSKETVEGKVIHLFILRVQRKIATV